MDLNLIGLRALVCGSTQGIGKACAMELAALGANITMIARNRDKLNKAKEELPSSHGQKHDFIIADFDFPAELKMLTGNYIKETGSFDILINNTGGPPSGPILDAGSDEFTKAFSNHLLCNHILAQSVIPAMKHKKFGRIINIISTSVKQPLKGLGVSNTIRAAVANWAKTLSFELAPFGITVNNVLPGATSTSRIDEILTAKSFKTGKPRNELEQEMISEIPMKRFAEPHEIAAAVAFLASPAAGYITGINVPVDGGRTGCL